MTVLLPCLNEAETISICVTEALQGLRRARIEHGEVLVADNGSTDQSVALAEAAGARVVHVCRRGYGAALSAGIRAATGAIIVIADSDGSYNIAHLELFIAPISTRRASVVIGDRFADGRPAAAAMPWTHSMLGNPLLSTLVRLSTGSHVRDFHCGLRSLRRIGFAHVDNLQPGMAWASHMILHAESAGLTVVNTATELRPDLRTHGRSHLRPLADGIAHLRVIARHALGLLTSEAGDARGGQ